MCRVDISFCFVLPTFHKRVASIHTWPSGKLAPMHSGSGHPVVGIGWKGRVGLRLVGLSCSRQHHWGISAYLPILKPQPATSPGLTRSCRMGVCIFENCTPNCHQLLCPGAGLCWGERRGTERKETQGSTFMLTCITEDSGNKSVSCPPWFLLLDFCFLLLLLFVGWSLKRKPVLFRQTTFTFWKLFF